MKDKVVPNNSQVKFKKTEVEDHHRISSISNKTKSVTTCNDSLKSRTSNVNAVCATCGKYVFNLNHDACVSKFLNDVNARTKKPTIGNISTRQPKSQANKSVATSPKKTIVQLIIFIVDSGCTKHMTGQYKLLGHLVKNIWVPFVLAMINLLQLLAMEIWFKEISRSTGSSRNDLLTDNRGSDLYTISLQVTTSSTPICFMAKASPTQAWLWHRRLSHLNFDYNNLLSKNDIVIGLPKLKYVKDQLCSSCEVSKAKRSSFKTKAVPSSKGRLNLLSYGTMWSMQDETPEVLKYFLKMIQRNLQAQVITIRTDRGTKFLNKTLHAYFKEEGIEHPTFTPRRPEQNGIFKRQNRTLVEVARTMLLTSKLLLFLKAEAIATTCYTQNISIIILTHEKTAYHIINDRKPSIRHLYIFGTSSVNKSSSPTDNSAQQDTPPTTNIQSSTEPTTPTNVNAEENNDNQAVDT
ncbi:retrovirus-related pol polyprotein from transposon TNT 1-94 [Tanacetum coccineum]|uniref:Retrovirus-related pol polyprotein from transposon TNT 1-94 n=1 Tax=Tanacetum coccineum TaxID=301880 RepID=A0ABQ5CXZ6_9ASTR